MSPLQSLTHTDTLLRMRREIPRPRLMRGRPTSDVGGSMAHASNWERARVRVRGKGSGSGVGVHEPDLELGLVEGLEPGPGLGQD